MEDTNITFSFLLFFFLLMGSSSFVVSFDGPLYDPTAYTECKLQPEEPLYGGGIIVDQLGTTASSGVYSPSFILHNLTQGTIYCFSSWVKIEGEGSGLIRASLQTENEIYNCVGTALAKHGCWSFLKGGFVLTSPSQLSILFFQNAYDSAVNIEIASSSLQPFSVQQWNAYQEYMINTKRKRAVTVHVSDMQGKRLQGAAIDVEQVSKDFPFGSAIAKTILGNLPYQNWFAKRFNAAVFENELKWYATEPEQGKTNYTVPDQMLQFVRANRVIARGHNIFWEDPKYTPPWVRNLTGSELHLAKLGPNATLHFFETAHKSDPLATLFMNDFNVLETCSDVNSTVDSYISRLRELRHGGALMDGIGLEGHFTVPNLPLMRAILDKLATLGLPIWLTEVDISSTLDKETQAIYLEQVLREGFSHPLVNGIMLWTALHPNGCYQMCLTDDNLQNLPAGDVVDKLLKEWQTGEVEGQTDEHGSYSFYGFLGEYRVSIKYGNRTSSSTFSLCQGEETRHVSIQL
ncbi:hypothetical protein COP1_035080 [Malus domestica]